METVSSHLRVTGCDVGFISVEMARYVWMQEETDNNQLRYAEFYSEFEISFLVNVESRRMRFYENYG